MKKCNSVIFLIMIFYLLFIGCGSKDDHHEHEQEAAADPVKSQQKQPVEDAGQHEHDEEGMVHVEGDWEKLVDLQTVEVKRRTVEMAVQVPGEIIPNQNEIAVVSPFIESSINCVFVNIGDRIKQGDLLVCLASPEIGILRAEYDKAKAELSIKKKNYERKQKLVEENIISEKSFQDTELEFKIAEVQYNYAFKKLLAMGVKKEEIDEPPTGHSEAVGSTIHVYAPISGVITHRDAKIGQKVNPATRLFEVVNLSTVWLEADIYEKDLVKIKSGQKVNVSVTAYPGEIFTGRIFFIGSTLNHDTKTIKILIEINNKYEKLKPGMFANTGIVVGEKVDVLTIPKEAVLEDENLKIVFVKEEHGYHRHVIETGIESGKYIEVLSGLDEGALIVTKGNYQLKSKLKMTGVDPHAGHTH